MKIDKFTIDCEFDNRGGGNMTTNRMVFSVEEMARELGISRPVAYELVKKDGFPAVRISDRRIVIPADKLRAWLNAQAER